MLLSNVSNWAFPSRIGLERLLWATENWCLRRGLRYWGSVLTPWTIFVIRLISLFFYFEFKIDDHKLGLFCDWSSEAWLIVDEFCISIILITMMWLNVVDARRERDAHYLFQDAHNLFEKMPQRNHVSWTSIFTAFNLGNLPSRTLSIFPAMFMSDRLEPDHFVYATLVKACASLCAIRQGKNSPLPFWEC